MGFLTFLEYLDLKKESTTPNLAVFYSNLFGFVSNHLVFYNLLFSLRDFMIFIFFSIVIWWKQVFHWKRTRLVFR
jgi:hypothetical protein